MKIELTAQECEYLANLLQSALGDLRQEIYHTDTFDYKEQLKAQEKLIHELLLKLGVEVPLAA
jgi:hypothetical protein